MFSFFCPKTSVKPFRKSKQVVPYLEESVRTRKKQDYFIYLYILDTFGFKKQTWNVLNYIKDCLIEIMK